MTSNLDQLLLSRACRYGAFIDVANRTNNIQAAILHNAPQLPQTTPLYREALHQIAYKLARLVNGQINDLDSWRDIAGYAMLVHNQIMAEQEAKAENSAFADKSRGGEALVEQGNKKAIDAMEQQITKDLKEA